MSKVMVTLEWPNSVVHDFGIHEVVLTGHQRHLRTFYGNQIPEYAIDINPSINPSKAT